MLVLLDAEWPKRSESFDRAVHRAIEAAEKAAATGKPLPEPRLQVVTRDVWAAAQAARKAKAYRSASIAQAAWAAAKDSTPSNVHFATTEAVQAARQLNSNTVKSAIEADYRTLLKLTAGGKWADATPVATQHLGGLWPTGYPRGWPASPEATAAGQPPSVRPADPTASIPLAGDDSSSDAAPPAVTPESGLSADANVVPRPPEVSAAGSVAPLSTSDADRIILPKSGDEVYRLTDAEDQILAPQAAPAAAPQVAEFSDDIRIRPTRRRRKRSSRTREKRPGLLRDGVGWLLAGALAGALLGAPISVLAGGTVFTSPEAWDPRPLVETLRTLDPGDLIAWQQALPRLVTPVATTLTGAVLAIPLGLIVRLARRRR